MALYPFLLDPIYKEKVWGGRSLERFGRELPGGPDTRIGESWELADLTATSPSGGGGAAAHSRIRNGPLIDRTIDDVLGDFAALVLGDDMPAATGGFPLLLKYLDARENLSVQVHPSPEYAAKHPEAHLKSEAWYVVDAEPGASIYKGVKQGVTPEAFEAAIRDGTVDEVLIEVPARPGDCHYLPSGTCHALGSGILIAEVQTPSDTTFRVFDWGRTDREIHLEQALECIDFGPVDTSASEPGTEQETADGRGRHLVEGEHFSIWEWSVRAGGLWRIESDRMSVLMIVAGEGGLEWGGDSPQGLRVRAGDTILLPAALERVDVRTNDELVLLEITLAERDTENGVQS